MLIKGKLGWGGEMREYENSVIAVQFFHKHKIAQEKSHTHTQIQTHRYK